MLDFQSERPVKVECVHIRAVGGRAQGRVLFRRCPPSFTVTLLDHSSLKEKELLYKFGFCTATVFNQEAAEGHKALGPRSPRKEI